jgi:hypothetical protein
MDRGCIELRHRRVAWRAQCHWAGGRGLRATRRYLLRRARRRGAVRRPAPWTRCLWALIILTDKRSGEPFGNQDFADVAAVCFQDAAAPRDSAHQTTQYCRRTRTGHGRVIEVAGLNQLTDALGGLDAKFTLACASRGLGVRSHKPRQVNGLAIRDDRIPFNDPDLLWADEGRRRVLRCYQNQSENRQEEPDHRNAPRRTPLRTA